MKWKDEGIEKGHHKQTAAATATETNTTVTMQKEWLVIIQSFIQKHHEDEK